MLHIIIVGFVAGIIARLLSPGPNNPSGFILTTLLGIAVCLATFIGQRSAITVPTRAPAYHLHHRRVDRIVHLEPAGPEAYSDMNSGRRSQQSPPVSQRGAHSRDPGSQ